MSNLRIFETNYWVVTHREDSRYAGYLMISSHDRTNELTDLKDKALNELGTILATSQKLLTLAYAPYKVIISKLGFTENINLHFHVIPVMT